MWHDASLQWLRVVQQDLGGGYGVVESRHFLLLSAYSGFAARGIIQECDSILLHLRARLQEAAWRWPYGKHVVLIFEDEETYYRYLSHFYAAGVECGASSGIFLKNGYQHTALFKSRDNRHMLTHLFVHLCLSHHANLAALAERRSGRVSFKRTDRSTEPRLRSGRREGATDFLDTGDDPGFLVGDGVPRR